MEVKSFKWVRTVKAFRIAKVENGKLYDESGQGVKPVSDDFFERYSPYAGAWFIFHPDGHQSICHDELFEASVQGEVEEVEEEDDPEMTASPKPKSSKLPDDMPLSSLAELSKGTLVKLRRAGFQTVGEVRNAYVVASLAGKSLTDLPGIGKATEEEIRDKLLNSLD